jgi:hypothetical protein
VLAVTLTDLTGQETNATCGAHTPLQHILVTSYLCSVVDNASRKYISAMQRQEYAESLTKPMNPSFMPEEPLDPACGKQHPTQGVEPAGTTQECTPRLTCGACCATEYGMVRLRAWKCYCCQHRSVSHLLISISESGAVECTTAAEQCGRRWDQHTYQYMIGSLWFPSLYRLYMQ